MVVGIVLAAGMSTRMGRLKQLLPLGGRPAIQWIVEVLIGRLDQVIVVLGHRADEIAPVVADYPVQTAINTEYDLGMLSSVQCGIRGVDEGADYLMCLGDQPQIDGAVVDQVLQTAKQVETGMVIPANQGKRGHPIFIRNTYRREILALGLDGGLNELMRKYPEDIHELVVGQSGILEDMDTPADYQRELDKWPQE